jgi:ferredoxin
MSGRRQDDAHPLHELSMISPAPPVHPSTPASPSASDSASATDLLRWPIVGGLLRWRHLRTATQIMLLLFAIVIVLHGLVGPQLAPKNLATVLTWIHYRGLLIGVLLAAGNAFCGACPMILVRDLARRIHRPHRHWPRWLGRKWIAIAGFAGVLFAYELFDVWALPAATAWLVLGYFGAAVLVDVIFTGAAFCKHVCPVGQFNFIASTLSPLELGVREPAVCRDCKTVDCIKGRRDAATPAVVVQRGCELALFLPSKVGNLDCTFCLDCVQACPHDNVTIGVRVPGEELADDRLRSAIGRLSRRADLAALALLFTFGALLNAFAMIGPVYALERWIAKAMGTTSEAPVLGLVFAIALGVIPLGLCASAAWLTRRLTSALASVPVFSITDIAVRYAYALVPFGVGVWLAHYGFHLLTGLWTIVPVAQSAMMDATGAAPLGEPNWGWLGMRPGAVFPLQIGAVVLGTLGSLVLAYRISERDYPDRAGRAAVPWLGLILGLAMLALWILAQPMEMRGTGLGG